MFVTSLNDMSAAAISNLNAGNDILDHIYHRESVMNSFFGVYLIKDVPKLESLSDSIRHNARSIEQAEHTMDKSLERKSSFRKIKPGNHYNNQLRDEAIEPVTLIPWKFELAYLNLIIDWLIKIFI
jgi:hypothetical protein